METVIVDAGPLVAYLCEGDSNHDWSAAQFQNIRVPLQTCDAVLSEALFLLRAQHNGARQFLSLIERRLVLPTFNLQPQFPAVAELIRRYEQVPMSLADACLVRMAELHPKTFVFTLDTDFRVYRKNRRQVIPLIIPN